MTGLKPRSFSLFFGICEGDPGMPGKAAGLKPCATRSNSKAREPGVQIRIS